jgi:hypothetical protein
MNRQVNPDHCYETDDGVMYMLVPAPGTPEWHVYKDAHKHRTFTSLMAAKGWLEHVLEHPESDKRVIVGGSVSAEFKAKLAAAINKDIVK